MTSIENILETVAEMLGKVLGAGMGSLASITEKISGISEGTTTPEG